MLLIISPEEIGGLPCCKGTMITYSQPGVHQDCHVLCCKAALQTLGPHQVLMCRAVSPQMQESALCLVELHEVLISPFLLPVEVPLDGSTTLMSISHSSEFCVISKPAEGRLHPVIKIINEDVELY